MPAHSRKSVWHAPKACLTNFSAWAAIPCIHVELQSNELAGERCYGKKGARKERACSCHSCAHLVGRIPCCGAQPCDDHKAGHAADEDKPEEGTKGGQKEAARAAAAGTRAACTDGVIRPWAHPRFGTHWTASKAVDNTGHACERRLRARRSADASPNGALLIL